MLAALSPARRRFVLYGAALVAILVLIGVTVAVVSRDPAATRAPQGAVGPVLLVPGYGGSSSALDVLARALRRSGRDTTVVRTGGNGTGDLRVQAEAVDDAVRRALDRTGAASVDLVGYSAGGVTVRLWARELGGAATARRILTLASPHHGTALAGLAADFAPDACPVACRQLAPDSDLLRRLNAGDETPDGPLWVSVWTTDDRAIVPATSGELAGALSFSVQSVCPGEVVAHGDVPRAPSVIGIVLLELGRALPTLPSSEVCSRG